MIWMVMWVGWEVREIAWPNAKVHRLYNVEAGNRFAGKANYQIV